MNASRVASSYLIIGTNDYYRRRRLGTRASYHADGLLEFGCPISLNSNDVNELTGMIFHTPVGFLSFFFNWKKTVYNILDWGSVHGWLQELLILDVARSLFDFMF